MLGTSIANGFTYRQSAIPTSPVAGQTWQQLNGSGVPILEYVFDGNFWRITGGRDGKSRLVYPATVGAVVTGSVTTNIQNVLIRRFTVGLGLTGTGKSVFNNLSASGLSPLGQPGSNAVFNVDYSKPIEIYTRVRLNKTGILRWYLTSSSVLAATAELDVRGYGVVIDLTTGNVTLQLHNGSILFSQPCGVLSWWAGNPVPSFDIELCWDGVSKLALYINGVYVAVINQSITGIYNFLLHLAYDQSVSGIQMFLDHHIIQTIGGY